MPSLLSEINSYLDNPKLLYLLLNATKNSGKHTINLKNAEKWIQAQTNPGRKLAAESIISTVSYIPYSKFLEFLKKMVNKFIDFIQDQLKGIKSKVLSRIKARLIENDLTKLFSNLTIFGENGGL